MGVDIFPYNLDSNYIVTVSTGESYSFTIGTQAQFVGFTSTSPISSITINAPDDGSAFDNLVFGQATAAAIPEPLTILGAMTAFGFGATFKRKLKK